LSEVAGVDASTLHRLLFWPPAERPDDLKFESTRPWPFGTDSVLVLDEASMLTPGLQQSIHDAWILNGARIIYVGDGYQLPPVLSQEEERNLGGKDFTVFGEVEGPQLSEVIRNDDDILHAATYIRERGKMLTESNGSYHFRARDAHKVIEDWLDDQDDHVIITWMNKTRMKVSEVIRKKLGHKSHLPEPGERIVFRRNGQGVLNGETAVVESVVAGDRLGPVQYHVLHTVDGAEIRVLTEGDEVMDGGFPKLSEAQWRAYQAALHQEMSAYRREYGVGADLRPIPITWGYCLTAHMMQGSEARRVTVYLEKIATSWRPMKEMTTLPNGKKMAFALRWMYCAITRAKQRCDVVVA
jgi:hypothetical protein